MSDISGRPPIVTDEDRRWALAQCPIWAIRDPKARDVLDDESDGEISDDPKPKAQRPDLLVWDLFVSDQIERFERFFNGELKSPRDWSNLWRKGWWPKAKDSHQYRRHVPSPKSAANAYPTFRKGQPEFECALQIATRQERRTWSHLGMVMFRPDDPRVARIRELAANGLRLSERSVAMLGGDQ